MELASTTLLSCSNWISEVHSLAFRILVWVCKNCCLALLLHDRFWLFMILVIFCHVFVLSISGSLLFGLQNLWLFHTISFSATAALPWFRPEHWIVCYSSACLLLLPTSTQVQSNTLNTNNCPIKILEFSISFGSNCQVYQLEARDCSVWLHWMKKVCCISRVSRMQHPRGWRCHCHM
jgi:hypothetical protein